MGATFWCFINIEQKDGSYSPLLTDDSSDSIISSDIDGRGDTMTTVIQSDTVISQSDTVISQSLSQDSTPELTFYEMTLYIKVFYFNL